MLNNADTSFNRPRKIKLSLGKTLKATPVFDSYWHFAVKRQDVFMKRVCGNPAPWTDDPIISAHKFTNAYRASDRVSQYLIKNVLYEGSQDVEEIFFRTILFKIFNRIETWETLKESFGEITWKKFNHKKYASVFDSVMAQKHSLYSAAYIMPSPSFGNERKHRNHLELLSFMMKNKVPKMITEAKNLKDVYAVLRSQPSFGDFLAFQFTIDLNYSTISNFEESEFVVAGPGAKDGISKCFSDTAGLNEAELIHVVTKMADSEFDRLGLNFQNLWGRPLQPIDCQNIFCEISKYARVAHPEYRGESGRVRIKQKFSQNYEPLPQFYPPKWDLKIPKSIIRLHLTQ